MLIIRTGILNIAAFGIVSLYCQKRFPAFEYFGSLLISILLNDTVLLPFHGLFCHFQFMDNCLLSFHDHYLFLRSYRYIDGTLYLFFKSQDASASQVYSLMTILP